MSARSIIFQQTIRFAHRSMKMPRQIYLPTIKCYDADKYDAAVARERWVDHVILGKSELTYCYSEGDYVHTWQTEVFHDLAGFIRNHYKTKLHGEYATYPVVITGVVLGPYHQLLMEGRIQEWSDKQKEVSALLDARLELHLQGAIHSLLQFLYKNAP